MRCSIGLGKLGTRAAIPPMGVGRGQSVWAPASCSSKRVHIHCLQRELTHSVRASWSHCHSTVPWWQARTYHSCIECKTQSFPWCERVCRLPCKLFITLQGPSHWLFSLFSVLQTHWFFPSSENDSLHLILCLADWLPFFSQLSAQMSLSEKFLPWVPWSVHLTLLLWSTPIFISSLTRVEAPTL